MKNASWMSKKDSEMMQGIAVMLMVFHHLFAFPERVDYEYVMLLDLSFLHCETILAYYGRICISLFAFLSGYGMIAREKRREYENLLEGYRCAAKRLGKFFLRYWLVYLIWVPTGYALGVYAYSSASFWKGLAGLNCNYNQEWWYVVEYVKMLLCFPVVACLFRRTGKHKPMIIIGLSAVLAMGTMQDITFAQVFSCAFSGMVIAEYRLFERLNGRLDACAKPLGWLGVIVCLAVLVSRIMIPAGVRLDCLFAPVWIWLCMRILNIYSCTRPLKRIAGYIGRYSTYIWLTHTFFAYYYFQRICYAPYYSWLIFVFCIMLSMLSGVVLEPLAGKIESRAGKR